MRNICLQATFVVIFFLGFSTSVLSKHPIVVTKYGPVIGSIELSRQNRQYNSFRGIPFAKPPINDLRFAASQPPEPWLHPINATQNGPICIQKNYLMIDPVVAGQEDCLQLNIYVPITNSRKPHPVMVFIYGGGFFSGSSLSDVFGAEYFMDKDIVLVTINYRLGVFGFLSTLDDVVPGNMGLKDQVLALKFIQENIAAFGGDKNKVTLFGQSSGGMSVNLHQISPSSKGLFHQAISQSGVALDISVKPFNRVQPAILADLANFTGCSQYVTNNSKLVECLRKIDANSLAETAEKFKYFSVEPLTPYTVVTETETTANPDPFLTKDPLEYLQAGDFQKVPYIAGTNQYEGLLVSGPFVSVPDTLNQLNNNFSTIIPKLLQLDLSVGNHTQHLYNDLVDFYMKGKPFIDLDDPASVEGFINVYSDRLIIYGVSQSMILQSKKGHKPIWMYNFNYQGDYTYFDLWPVNYTNSFNYYRPTHCDELLYLFKSPALFPDLKTSTDLIMSEKLINIWTNFAIFGNPDPDNSLGWTSLNFDSVHDVRSENLQFFNISGSSKSNCLKFEMQKGYYPERNNFWRKQNLAENFP